MSDTPRTDDWVLVDDRSQSGKEVVLADTMRDLERELAEAQAGIECAQQVEQVLRERIAELERSEAELAGRVVGLELSLGMSERERDRAQWRIAELKRERDGGVGYGLTTDDLGRLPYNLERKHKK